MLTVTNTSASCVLGRAALSARAGASASARRASPPVAKASPVRRVGARDGIACRVVQDPMRSFDLMSELDGAAASSSFDLGGSIDSDPVARRDAVERDTAAKLRETIAKMGGEQIMDPRAFVSTDEQRLVTAGLFASCAALVLRGACGVQFGEEAGSPLAWAELLGSVAAAYWLSDVGTGIFHWSVDNYGGKNTPVMGGIIDAFQGHHKYPWTITKRQFANNIHTTCPATMCVTVPLLLTPGLNEDAAAFMGTFCALIVLSQQFHAWSHMKKSQLPELVVKAQEAGVLLSRKAHGAHHRPPFRGNYCIVSGWWNELLDGSGFFLRLEKSIFAATGVAPRCWSDDDGFAVQEEAPEGWGEGIL